MGFSWVASGSTGSWRDTRNTTYVGFAPLSKLEESGAKTPAAYVLDDTLELSLSPASLSDLDAAARAAEAGKARFLSVSDWLLDPRAQASLAVQPGTLAPWSGDYSPWIGQPLKRTAWRLLAEAARALDSAQTAGTLAPRLQEAAGRELLNAESGRAFLNLDSRLPAAAREESDRNFRATLSNVYRILNQPAPESLQRSIDEEAAGPAGPAAVDSGEDWITFNDPTGENTTAGGLARAMTSLESFTVSWDTEAVKFAVKVSSTADSMGTTYGFGGMMFDIYIDLNNRNGAGLTALLPGREAMAESRDAWEFAISATGWGAQLYRVGPGGNIVPLVKLTPRLDRETSTIVVAAPTEYLRGNPKNWGYIVNTMVLDPNTAAQDYPLPMKDSRGSALLDVLAPWQKDAPTAAQRRRLEAVRLR